MAFGRLSLSRGVTLFVCRDDFDRSNSTSVSRVIDNQPGNSSIHYWNEDAVYHVGEILAHKSLSTAFKSPALRSAFESQIPIEL